MARSEGVGACQRHRGAEGVETARPMASCRSAWPTPETSPVDGDSRKAQRTAVVGQSVEAALAARSALAGRPGEGAMEPNNTKKSSGCPSVASCRFQAPRLSP
jgi:hypothetical protein